MILRFELITLHVIFGGHKAVVRPDPFPNSAVKHSLADGSSSIGSARVGCRQSFIKKAETLTRFGFFVAANLEVCILRTMKQASATAIARNFAEYLGKVEHGQSVQILKHGKVVARLVPDAEFMSGKEMAKLFAHHQSDPETADAIERELEKLKKEEDDALADRYRHSN